VCDELASVDALTIQISIGCWLALFNSVWSLLLLRIWGANLCHKESLEAHRELCTPARAGHCVLRYTYAKVSRPL
jgi:hypothetical protein